MGSGYVRDRSRPVARARASAAAAIGVSDTNSFR
jgi:hypothetical protein